MIFMGQGTFPIKGSFVLKKSRYGRGVKRQYVPKFFRILPVNDV